MAGDLDGYESGPLDAGDRQRVRRDFQRTDLIWQTFGQLATFLSVIVPLAKSWKTWLAAGAATGALNYEKVSQAIAVLGSLQ